MIKRLHKTRLSTANFFRSIKFKIRKFSANYNLEDISKFSDTRKSITRPLVVRLEAFTRQGVGE